MSQSVLQLLTQARALIQQPERWTQNTYARDVTGDPVDPRSTEAFCWCTIGAIAKVSEGQIVAQEARDHLVKTAMHVKLDRFNDTMTHRAVLEAFDKAIENVPG